jgi:hypothetical protein
MMNSSSIDRNKNMILNVAVILIALFVAYQFYKKSSTQIDDLVRQQNEAIEKNKVTQEIATLEKRAEQYRGNFVRKDLGTVMDMVSGMAKSSSVRISSVKPYAEEPMDNYFNSSFLISLRSPSYHALGDFISRIENDKDVYLVSDVNINAVPVNAETKEPSVELDVNLKINTISYL